ncbi:Mucin-12 [Acarospora aff. strigata]|nr:Mucin-12 [Acarospora aff. strigata]
MSSSALSVMQSLRSTRTVRLTQTITSSIAPTAVVDSSCGGCKVVANGAHLLYWYDEVLHIPVETVVYKGVNATSSFPSVSHSVGITKPLPAAGATKTLLYEENVNDIETGPKHIATNIVSGFAATYPTPYIVYTGYEIEKVQLLTANGTVVCSTTTVSSHLPQASAIAYSGKPSIDWAGPGERSGSLPASFVQAAGVQSCSAGTYRGIPTLEVVIGTYTLAHAVSPVHVEQSAADLGPVAVTADAAAQGPPSASPAQFQASTPPAETKPLTAVATPTLAGKSSDAMPLPPQSSGPTNALPATSTEKTLSSGTAVPLQTVVQSFEDSVGAAPVIPFSPTTKNLAASPAVGSVPSTAQQPQPQQQQPGKIPATVSQGSLSAQVVANPAATFVSSLRPSASEALTGSSPNGATTAQSIQLVPSPITSLITFITTSDSSTFVITQTLSQGNLGIASSALAAASTGPPTTTLRTLTAVNGDSTFVATETIVQNSPQATTSGVTGGSSEPQLTRLTTYSTLIGSSASQVTETIVQDEPQSATASDAGQANNSPTTKLTIVTKTSGSSTFAVTETTVQNEPQSAPLSNGGETISLDTKLTTFTTTSDSSTFAVTATLLQNGSEAPNGGAPSPRVTELRTFMKTSGSSTFVATETVIASAVGATPVATVSGFADSQITQVNTVTKTSGSSTFLITETMIVGTGEGGPGATRSGVAASQITRINTVTKTSGSSTFLMAETMVVDTGEGVSGATRSGVTASQITELRTFTRTSGTSASVVTETVVVDASGGIPGAIMSGINGGPGGSAPSETQSSIVNGTTPAQFQGSAITLKEDGLAWLAHRVILVSLVGLWLM